MKAKVIAEVFESYANFCDGSNKNIANGIVEEASLLATSVDMNKYYSDLVNRIYYDISDGKHKDIIYPKLEMLLSYFYVLEEEHKND